MKKFKEFMNEETMPFAQTDKGFVGIDSEAVRDNINSLLNGVTTCGFITPYIALEKVRKVLANFHIFLPKVVFNDGDSGIHTFEISQFGEKTGMTNDGKVVTRDSDPFHLYFEWQMSDDGMFDIFAEIVDEDELEELIDDYNEEEDEKDEEEELDEEMISELHKKTKESIAAVKARIEKRHGEAWQNTIDKRAALKSAGASDTRDEDKERNDLAKRWLRADRAEKKLNKK